MTDFKQRFSPTSTSGPSQSSLPSFLASSPHLETSGSPNIYNLLTESSSSNNNNNNVDPPKTSCAIKSNIVVDNSKFDFNSWITNKRFLSVVAFIILIAMIITGICLVKKSNKTRNTQENVDANDANDTNDAEYTNDTEYAKSGNKNKLAGSPSGNNQKKNPLVTNAEIYKEITKQRNDIRFIMSQLNQCQSHPTAIDKSKTTS